MELRPPDPPLGTSSSSCDRGSIRDVPAIVAACNDPEIGRWTTVPSPYTERDARAWLERCETAWTDGAAPLAVVERASGELAAAITLWLHGRVGELGYWAAPRTAAAATCRGPCGSLCAWAFDELGCRECSSARSRATVSERVAEKCGFTREGVLRAWMEQRGERRDVTMWSLPTRRSRVAPSSRRSSGGCVTNSAASPSSANGLTV